MVVKQIVTFVHGLRIFALFIYFVDSSPNPRLHSAGGNVSLKFHGTLKLCRTKQVAL